MSTHTARSVDSEHSWPIVATSVFVVQKERAACADMASRCNDALRQKSITATVKLVDGSVNISSLFSSVVLHPSRPWLQYCGEQFVRSVHDFSLGTDAKAEELVLNWTGTCGSCFVVVADSTSSMRSATIEFMSQLNGCSAERVMANSKFPGTKPTPPPASVAPAEVSYSQDLAAPDRVLETPILELNDHTLAYQRALWSNARVVSAAELHVERSSTPYNTEKQHKVNKGSGYNRFVPCKREYDVKPDGWLRYSGSDLKLMEALDSGKYPLWDHLRYFTQMSGRQTSHHVRRRVVRVVAYDNATTRSQIEAIDATLQFCYQAGHRGSGAALCGVFCGPEVDKAEALAFCVKEAVEDGAFSI